MAGFLLTMMATWLTLRLIRYLAVHLQVCLVVEVVVDVSCREV